ncbi:MAG: hypothetical protein DSY76_04035 [Bacteroidetes bacterium]|nr:MAG: hypothetical protein DSY76_04035 [Bacteroidota bacterium]
MNLNEENIGKFFQKNLKDVEIQPDKAVWSAIQKRADIKTGMSLLAKLSVGFILTALAITTYVVIQNNNSDNPLEVIASSHTIIETSPNKNTTNKLPIESKQNNIASDTIKKDVFVEKQNKKKTQKTKLQQKPQKKESIPMVKLTKASAIKQPSPDSTEKVESIVENKELSPKEVVYQAHLIDLTDNDTNMDTDTSVIIEEVVTSQNDNDTTNITFSENPSICFGEDAILKVIGGQYYDWSTGATTASIKVSPVEQSDYWVVVRDEFGNEIKHTFTVFIDRECTAVYVPSAFTPNGDGVNDKFKAEGVGIESFKMVIFNREGQKVFESSNIDDAWDGSFHNAIQQAQTFFYTIQYVDAKGNAHIKQGQVTLIR